MIRHDPVPSVVTHSASQCSAIDDIGEHDWRNPRLGAFHPLGTHGVQQVLKSAQFVPHGLKVGLWVGIVDMNDPLDTDFHAKDEGIAKGDPQISFGRMYGQRRVCPAEITGLVPRRLDIFRP